MELRVLRYFLAVAREQNITRAAESLHVTQPTLSKQLMDLEEELGQKLFVRGKRKVTLTEAGEFLRRRAQEIAELADKTEEAFRKTAGEISGDIWIACGETEGMRILVRAMKKLHERFPDVRFHLYSGNDADVADRLDKGLADFGLFVGTADLDKYDHLGLLFSDTWGLLLRKDHPLAAKAGIERDDLKEIPLLCSRQALEQNEFSGWLGGDAGKLHILSTHNLVRNTAIMVEEGLGCAVSLDRLVNTQGTTLVFRPFSPPLKADLVIVWKKYQVFSRPAEKFLALLQEELGG